MNDKIKLFNEQEFDTRFACEFAKEHIISVKKPPHAFCLAKGTP